MKDSDLRKIPMVTAAFWVMKIMATTLGETAGDFFSKEEGLNWGYAKASMVLLPIFIVLLGLQLAARSYRPFLFWAVVLATSTIGTTVSDFMDRTLGLGYGLGSALLVSALVMILLAWRFSGEPLSVDAVQSRRTECFYWSAILVSNTLGTALGDWMSKEAAKGGLGLELAPSTLLVGGVLLFILLLRLIPQVSRVALFWLAFILTRPLGANLGDLLAEPRAEGGLGFGLVLASAMLFAILLGFVARESLASKESA